MPKIIVKVGIEIRSETNTTLNINSFKFSLLLTLGLILTQRKTILDIEVLPYFIF